MQESKSDLKSVKRQFKLWRKNRPYRRAGIPARLWHEAVRLCEDYPVGQVRVALGLDHSKLKSKVAELNAADAMPDFVNIELPALKSADSMCEWVRSDGAKLRVQIDQSQLNQVVANFFGGRP